MIVYNVKDNFVIPFTFKDENGLSTSVPSKFVVSLTTGNHRHFSFSQGYGEPLPSGVTIVGDVVNISIDDENLLGPGSLVASVACALVNSSYPDGYKRWSYSQPLGIVLVRGSYESVVGGSVNGIESIHVLESLVSGGENKVTIKETNGSDVDFIIRNGVKGDKGDQGNSGYSGAAGELEVVNNLTDGGATSALSAEQGKVLKAMTSEYTYPIIDVSVGNNTGAIVPAAGGHTWSNGTSYKGRCFDVSDMRGWRLRIRHNESVLICSFAFLNATPVNGQPISYCDGETLHSGVNEEEVIVPNDATLLYVQRLISTGTNITPIVEILAKDKDTMYGLSNAIDNLNVRTKPLDFGVEIGTYAGAGIKQDSTTRMRAKVVFANPKSYVDVKTKTGYLANLVFYNEGGTDPVLAGWSSNIHIINNSYPYFYIVFKRSDDGTVTSEDLDCVQSAIVEGLDTRVTNIEQEIQSPYADRPSSGYETFEIQCNTVVSNTDGENLSAQDSEILGNDKCRVYLPESYQKSGTPTRLIIHCHGASVNYNYNNFSNKGINDKILDYLVARGYAVLLVNGLPGNSTLQIGTTSGSPLAYQSHIKAYKYVVNKYNLRKDGTFVYGISAGSIPALQIANFTNIPVLAQIIYCGIYSVPRAFMLLGGYSEYYAEMKQYIATQYAFTGDWSQSNWSGTDPVSDAEWKYIIDNNKKFAGWNTYLRGASTRMSQSEYSDFVGDYYGSSLPSWIDSENISFDTVDQLLMTIKVQQKNTQNPSGATLNAVNAEKTLYDSVSLYRNVPIKLFHSIDDNTAPYRYAKYYYEMLKRGGSQVEFRTFSSGGHSPYGNDMTVVIDGKTVNTCVFAIESLLFCERFDTQS